MFISSKPLSSIEQTRGPGRSPRKILNLSNTQTELEYFTFENVSSMREKHGFGNSLTIKMRGNKTIGFGKRGKRISTPSRVFPKNDKFSCYLLSIQTKPPFACSLFIHPSQMNAITSQSQEKYILCCATSDGVRFQVKTLKKKEAKFQFAFIY